MDRISTYLGVLLDLQSFPTRRSSDLTSAAEGPIGVAAVVRNTVSQLEPHATRIAKGDEIVRDEGAHAHADRVERLENRVYTNLSLEPSSTLKLDRTVFDDPKAGDIAI